MVGVLAVSSKCFSPQGEAGIRSLLPIVRSCAGSGGHGECVSAFPVCFNMGVFSFT